MDILICTEGGIHGKQQPTNENCGRRRGRHPKLRMGQTFTQKRQEGTEENWTLVPGTDGTTLNATCYNCSTPGNLAYNCSEAGRTGTCFIQVTHRFLHTKVQHNEPINNNWILLDTCYSASVLKMHLWQKNVHKCKADEKLLMLTNGGHLSFYQMAELLFFQWQTT